MTDSPAPDQAVLRGVRARGEVDSSVRRMRRTKHADGNAFTIGARCMALPGPECRNDSATRTCARICRRSFDALARHARVGEIGVQAAFARFNEDFAGRAELHPIRPEIAEVAAHTAPRAQRPHAPPTGQAQRFDLADAFL